MRAIQRLYTRYNKSLFVIYFYLFWQNFRHLLFTLMATGTTCVLMEPVILCVCLVYTDFGQSWRHNWALTFFLFFLFEGQVSKPRNKRKRENRFMNRFKSTTKQGQQGSASVEKRFSHTEHFSKMPLLPKCKISSQNKPCLSLRFWSLFWCDNSQNNEAWLPTFPRVHFINSQSTDIKIYYFFMGVWLSNKAAISQFMDICPSVRLLCLCPVVQLPSGLFSAAVGGEIGICAAVLWWISTMWASEWVVLNDTDGTCDVSVWVISGNVRWWTHEDEQLLFCDEALSFTQPLAEWRMRLHEVSQSG